LTCTTNLPRLRRALGWSRRELSELPGRPRETLGRWERGESRIADEHKARLCDLYGVSVTHLMSLDVPTSHRPVEPLRLVT
jgi:transcriptional regulator with XRE-family HTH domain